jgi:cell division protein FtsA
MSKIVVGLDIGTTKIACFVGRKNEHDKIEILSMGKSESLGVMRGMVSNIEKTIQSIKTAVEEARERVDGNLVIKSVNVYCSVASRVHRG